MMNITGPRQVTEEQGSCWLFNFCFREISKLRYTYSIRERKSNLRILPLPSFSVAT